MILSALVFYFIRTRSPPKRSNTAPPALPTGRESFHIPPPPRLRVFGFVVVFNRRLAAALSHDEFCFIYFFAPEFDGRNNTTASSPIVIVLRAVPPSYIPSLRSTFGWLLCPPIQWKPTKPKASLLTLFLFFVRSIRRPK
jgi:hypothetical protein